MPNSYVDCLGRRTFMQGAVATAVASLGCSRQEAQEPSGNGVNVAEPAPQAPPVAMTVYRDPGCGCCEAWANLARQAGYGVTMIDDQDMPAVKARLGVPETLASCHTAEAGGYVLEGHVPFDAVKRLLSERPKDIRGIAVAGMPRGSPGMEMPDGSRDSFEVMAFDGNGRASPYQP